MMSTPIINRARLLQLAEEANIHLKPRTPDIPSTPTPTSSRSPTNESLAEQVLQATKEKSLTTAPTSPTSKLFRTKSKKLQYSYKDISAALSSVVKNNGSAGVAEILIEKLLDEGGDANLARRATTSTVKKWKGVNTTDERNHNLKIAVGFGNYGMTQVLLRQADQRSKDEALETGLLARNIALVDLLLRFGGNAGHFEALFAELVERSEWGIVSVMLKSQKSVSLACATECLGKAASVGCLDAVLALVDFGADGDFHEAAALKLALRQLRKDIAMAIITSPHPPSQTSLDHCMDMVFKEIQDLETRLWFLETLLAAGAAGPVTSRVLVDSTMQGCIKTMELLVRYNTSIEFEQATALKDAVRRSNVEQVGVLLKARSLSPNHASAAFALIDNTSPEDVQYRLASMLLNRGACGVPVHEALIQAVRAGFQETIKMLIDGRRSNTACTHYKDAKALRDAVLRQQVPIVRLLMTTTISTQSLATAFALICNARKSDRFELTQLFLDKGARGHEVDRALMQAVMDQSVDRDERLIALLVQKGASVDFNHEKVVNPLQVAALQGDIKVLELLLRGRPSRETVSSGMPAAMKLQESANRFETVQFLIKAGAFGVRVADSLVTAISSYSDDEALLKLLLKEGKADVNHNGGNAIREAAKRDANILALVMTHGNPNTESIGNALQAAMELEPRCLDESKTLEILLKREKPQTAINAALVRGVQIIQDVSPKPLRIIKTLLSAGANVNFQNGRALEIAVKAIDLDTMDLLLSRRPEIATINSIFPSAVLINDLAKQEQVYRRLLQAGAQGEEVSKALATAVKAGPASTAVLRLLVPEASVDFEGGKVLCLAVKHYVREQFVLLLGCRPSAGSLNSAFATAMRSKNQNKKYEVFQLLLDAGVKGDLPAEALVSATVNQDRRLMKLLLDHGSSLDFKDGAALVAAVKSSDPSLLRILMSSTRVPSLSSLSSAFREAMSSENGTAQHEFYAIFLEGGMTGELLDMALLAAVRIGPSSKAICELLLRFDASVNYLDGAAIDLATQSGLAEILEILLKQGKASQSTLARAFTSSFQSRKEDRLKSTALILTAGLRIDYDDQINSKLLSETKAFEPDHQYLRLLLSHNASVHFDNNASLLHAAKIRDHETLEVLVEFLQDSNATTIIFAECEREPEFWKASDGLRVMEILLERGAGGPAVDTLLVQAISDYDHENAPSFVNELLQYNADVNVNNGIALQLAAKKANHELLVSLLQHNPSSLSLSAAFPIIFEASTNSNVVLGLVELFVNQAGDQDHTLDVDYESPDFEPILVLALNNYPRSPDLMRTLLRAGYYVDTMVRWQFDEKLGDENVSLLCWCLAIPENKISDSVIEVLIEEGANVNFKTPASNLTVLTLAVEKGRPKVVQKLLDSGADANSPSADGISCLTKASGLGDIELMNSLIAAGAEPDDGSLHDAARNLRPDAITVLVRAGHSTEFPSLRHEGRSALAELCSKYTDRRSQSPGRIEQLIKRTMKALIDCGANALFRHHGKSLLLIALDSANPYAVTKPLLELTWESMNDKANLYTSGRFTYSAVAFVEKGLAGSPRPTHTNLLKLLKDVGVARVYFANKAPQPADYEGAPQHLIDAQRSWEAEEESKQRIEEEHLRRLRHKEEVSNHAMAQSEREHRRRIDQENQNTQTQIANRELMARSEFDTRANSERQAAAFRQRSRTLEIEHERAIGQTRLEVKGRERQLQLDFKGKEAQLQLKHKNTMLQVEAADRSSRDEMQRREHDRRVHLLSLEEGSSQRGHDRNVRLIEMQRSGVKESRMLVDSQSRLASQVGAGMASANRKSSNRKPLGYIEDA